MTYTVTTTNSAGSYARTTGFADLATARHHAERMACLTPVPAISAVVAADGTRCGYGTTIAAYRCDGRHEGWLGEDELLAMNAW